MGERINNAIDEESNIGVLSQLSAETDIRSNITVQVNSILEQATAFNNIDKARSNFVFSDTFAAFKEYVATLDGEQLACLSNFFGFVIIIGCLNGIIISYYGVKLIAYFQLESKFPSLGKFIKLRTKFSE